MNASAPPDLSGLAWRKSCRSGSNANCVELAPVPKVAAVAVRDSRDPDGPVLLIGQPSWAAFVAAAKRGAIHSS
jgi:hypothetical protein